MKTIKITSEVEIAFNKVLEQYEKSDVADIIGTISDYFEDYETDCAILNKIISLLLSFEPNKDDLKALDVDSLKAFLKII